MKTSVFKFPPIAVLLACAALAPRPVAAQPGGDSYVIMVRPGTNLIANHLDSGDNTLNQVLPVVAPGSHLLKWDEAAQSFHTDDYQGALGGWTDSSGMPSTTTLGAREAAFLVNPGTTAYPLTISGNPRTNGPPPPLARGVLHYVSRATKGVATIADFYSSCCNPDDHCTVFLRWNPGMQSWQSNVFTACHWSLGEPAAEVGEGVAIWLPTNPPPPTIICPPNLTVFGCDPETPVAYRAAYGTNRWISCFPPSGTLFTLGTHPVSCTATTTCGIAISNSFQVTVRPPVAQWPWPSPLPGIGIPVEPVGGATVVHPPAGSSSTTGPALEIIPSATIPNSGVRLRPGPAQAISFTTVLDFTAPEGAGLDLKLPPSSMNTNDIPLLSFRRKSGPKGYCVKTMKAFADDPSGEFRLAMVNTNGQLLNPVTLTTAEMRDTEYFVLAAQPGVTSCHVTVELSLLDGSITLEFDGPVTTAVGRKGWDGCIYGPDRPIKKAQARFYVGPPPFPGAPPITELLLVASGVAEIVIEEPALTAIGRKWGDGHVTLMKAYDDGSTERGMQFTPLADGGGVTIDTGYSSSFNVRLHHLQSADSPGNEELLTRTIGPIRGLTNRPPPPFLDALLLKAASSGVECSADFSNLGSPTVLVQILNQGMIVAERAGVPATLGNPLFTMSDWPDRLGKLGGATPCRRGKPPIFGAFILPGGGGLPPQVVMGDEFRVLAELPPGAPHPNYYSGFELLGSAGATWGVTHLQTTSALSPPTATITAGPLGITIDGATEGFGYLGATSVTGPFYDLGVVAGTVTGTNTTPIKLPPLRESPSLIFKVRESPTRCCRGGNPY